MATLVVLLALAIIAPVAHSAVSTPTGASADTSLVCNRLGGSSSLITQSQGFEYLAVYTTSAYSGPFGWGSWLLPSQVPGYEGLPSAPGGIAKYVVYADWTGSAWTYVGEWAKVRNARGVHVGWYC
ncbi:hypothetical protein [Miltoncostaea oceani]|uniref:hypothetical protein n=1 Tax=Miltoncostaea oceani TaxID=2843216 RepID=UPI001C3C96D4|nr:hypothetical protein [Miltoncostaea oceani]